jgi:hypothetical protein
MVDQISEGVTRRGPAVRVARAGRIERTVVWAVAAAVVVAAVAVWATSRGGSEQTTSPPATTATTEQPAPAAAPLPALDPAAAAAPPAVHAPAAPAPTPAPAPDPILADGRHPAYLTAVDVTGGTVQFDVVQYLTGEAAREYAEHEYEEEYGEEIEYEYDSYTVNENPRLRSLPVAPGVAITVLRTADSSIDPHGIAFADLPAYLDGLPSNTPGVLGSNVYWLTVRDDTVVAMEEQFES